MVIFDLGPRSFTYEKLELVLSVTTGPFSAKAIRNKEMKIHQHNAGHMTKIAAMPIMFKH